MSTNVFIVAQIEIGQPLIKLIELNNTIINGGFRPPDELLTRIEEYLPLEYDYEGFDIELGEIIPLKEKQTIETRLVDEYDRLNDWGTVTISLEDLPKNTIALRIYFSH